MPVPAALAGVHRANEHEAAGESDGPGRAGDGDLPVLQRLAHDLQHVGAEFRQLIEEEHAVVGDGEEPRPRDSPAAGKAGHRNRVVRRAEGARRHDGAGAACEPRNGVDLRRFDHLLARHIRQDSGQTLGHHGFARARRADEQHVVTARRGDLKGALDVLLALDVRKVGDGAGERLRRRGGRGGDALFTLEVTDQLGDSFHRVNRDLVGKGGLERVLRGDIELADALALCGERHGQRAGDRPELPGQGELAEKGAVLRRLFDVP